MEKVEVKINSKERKAIKYFKFLRPHLIKLFAHCVILYISIRAFIEFQQSESNYSDFISKLNSSVIINIETIDYNSSCQDGWEEMESTVFPQINDGCRCDYNVYQKDTCDTIYQNLKYNQSTMNEFCAILDNPSTTNNTSSSNISNGQTTSRFLDFNFTSNI
jgi:hypothetical protein